MQKPCQTVFRRKQGVFMRFVVRRLAGRQRLAASIAAFIAAGWPTRKKKRRPKALTGLIGFNVAVAGGTQGLKPGTGHVGQLTQTFGGVLDQVLAN